MADSVWIEYMRYTHTQFAIIYSSKNTCIKLAYFNIVLKIINENMIVISSAVLRLSEAHGLNLCRGPC